jgi:transposase
MNEQSATPIHPRWLAAALLYGLVRGIHSSRKLEEACAYRFNLMWLVKGQRARPHYVRHFSSAVS